MKIRSMIIDDYEQVYNLWMNTPGMGLNTVDDSREGTDKYLRRNPDTCFVAEDSGRIVGAIMAGHDGRRGYIYHTTVAADYRRQGLGRRMVECVLKALEDEGINKVALVAFERNELGNAFWENAGFTAREDLVYRNKSIHELVRIDT